MKHFMEPILIQGWYQREIVLNYVLYVFTCPTFLAPYVFPCLTCFVPQVLPFLIFFIFHVSSSTGFVLYAVSVVPLLTTVELKYNTNLEIYNINLKSLWNKFGVVICCLHWIQNKGLTPDCKPDYKLGNKTTFEQTSLYDH